MTAAPAPATGAHAAGAAPEPAFAVTGARPAAFSAVPTVEFRLALDTGAAGPVRSVLLATDVRIAPARRRYDAPTRRLLAELFGAPERWATGLQPLTWARLTTVVPPFEGTTEVALPVPCGHDVQLAVTKYLRALPDDGDVPLDFAFSGTVFHGGAALRTSRISWESHAGYRLPVALWRKTVGDGGWARLSADTCRRLDAHRAAHALADWDETIRTLLDRAGAETSGAPWTPGAP